MDEITNTMLSFVSENIQNTMDDIFDDRNPNVVEESKDFIYALSSIVLSSKKTPLTEEVHNYLLKSFDLFDEMVDNDEDADEIANMKNNITDNFISNQSMSDVEAFTTLYDKGIIKDSAVQKYRASQLQDMKTTFSNLMGGEWDGWAPSPSNNLRSSVNDWIDGNYLVRLNDSICNNENSAPIEKGLIAKSLKFDFKGLSSTIADGIYEDMNTNAYMCTIFTALVSLITRQELDDTMLPNLKRTLDQLMSFKESYGMNDFFTCACMGVNGVYYSTAYDLNDEVHRNTAIVNALKLQSWYDGGYKILLPNKNIFPYKLSSLLKTAEVDYDFGLTASDAKQLGLPSPVLMPNLLFEIEDDRQSGMILEESIKIGQSLQKCTRFDSTNDNLDNCAVSDSLVERFQVESDTASKKELSALDLHTAIMENYNRLFHNASRHEYNALKINLATNMVMMEEVNTILNSDRVIPSSERRIIEEDLKRMEYQNSKYIGVVEACSNESVHTYAVTDRDNILKGVTDLIKRV